MRALTASDKRLPVPPGARPGPPTVYDCRAVRPAFFLQHTAMARDAEGLAAIFPRHTPPPLVVAMAAVKDLAWLSVFLRDAPSPYRPIRENLVGFLLEQAAAKNRDWLDLSLDDEPLRWGFRVRVAPELGEHLTRLLRSVFAFGDLVDVLYGRDLKPSVVNITALVEIDWAIAQMPKWRSPLLEIRSSIPGASQRAVPE